jgi:nitrite reductase/ring-hydroxylating ferredoxin subunit
VVSLSSAVPAGVPVRVVHGNDEFVLFREADGHCRALVDRCAHRRAESLISSITIECREHIDPCPVRASNNVVSRTGARTSMAATTELS